MLHKPLIDQQQTVQKRVRVLQACLSPSWHSRPRLNTISILAKLRITTLPVQMQLVHTLLLVKRQVWSALLH